MLYELQNGTSHDEYRPKEIYGTPIDIITKQVSHPLPKFHGPINPPDYKHKDNPASPKKERVNPFDFIGNQI